MFILKTAPHPTIGDAYVIVTDHADDGYGRAIKGSLSITRAA